MLEAHPLKLSIPRMTERTFQPVEEYYDEFARETDVNGGFTHGRPVRHHWHGRRQIR